MNDLLTYLLIIIFLWILAGVSWNTLSYQNHEDKSYRYLWIGYRLKLLIIKLWNVVISIPIALLEICYHALEFLKVTGQTILMILLWPVVPYLVRKRNKSNE